MVLLYASKYHDIRTVVSLSGRYDLKKDIALQLGKDFMEIIKKEGFIDVKTKTGNLQCLCLFSPSVVIIRQLAT